MRIRKPLRVPQQYISYFKKPGLLDCFQTDIIERVKITLRKEASGMEDRQEECGVSSLNVPYEHPGLTTDSRVISGHQTPRFSVGRTLRKYKSQSTRCHLLSQYLIIITYFILILKGLVVLVLEFGKLPYAVKSLQTK